ncbi:MAG TPA: hypothetical protein VHA52_00565 [Candidatus Babeliaceae bacterium]|nr:hypothetical protein [Candidatus Babeliaceae bacterium]
MARSISIFFYIILFIASLEGSYQGTTVFIHGAIPAFLSFWAPPCLTGLNPLRNYDINYGRGTIGYTLHTSFPERFPLNSLYIYGWTGDLTLESRYNAAEDLYNNLKKLPEPYTIIAHSHGCNVALNLKRVAEAHNDQKFKVELLVLLACPVQVATSGYIRSSVFEKVFSFYSAKDIGQIIDPQGLYFLPYSILTTYNIPIFSDRIFCPSPNLIQARILIHKRNPWHSDFTLPRFLNYLLPILDLLEKTTNIQRKHPSKPLIVNITWQGNLELYESTYRRLKRIVTDVYS